MSARNRELATLFLAALVASAAFASAWFQDAGAIDYGWVPWAVVLGGLFAVAHVVTRATVPAMSSSDLERPASVAGRSFDGRPGPGCSPGVARPVSLARCPGRSGATMEG